MFSFCGPVKFQCYYCCPSRYMLEYCIRRLVNMCDVLVLTSFTILATVLTHFPLKRKEKSFPKPFLCFILVILEDSQCGNRHMATVFVMIALVRE